MILVSPLRPKPLLWSPNVPPPRGVSGFVSVRPNPLPRSPNVPPVVILLSPLRPKPPPRSPNVPLLGELLKPPPRGVPSPVKPPPLGVSLEKPPPRPPVKPPPLLGALPVKPPTCGPWNPVKSLEDVDFSSVLPCPPGGVTWLGAWCVPGGTDVFLLNCSERKAPPKPAR